MMTTDGKWNGRGIGRVLLGVLVVLTLVKVWVGPLGWPSRDRSIGPATSSRSFSGPCATPGDLSSRWAHRPTRSTSYGNTTPNQAGRDCPAHRTAGMESCIGFPERDSNISQTML